MTVLQIRRSRKLFPAVLLGLLVSAPAAAQSQEEIGEPLRLSPFERQEGQETPEEPAVDPDAIEEIEERERLPGEGAEGIEVDLLDELDPETIGVLDPGRGGLGAEIWEGTPRWVVERLLPRLPDDLHSPVLRDLARRLLLSSTAPPVRERTVEGAGENLLTLRLQRLAALGDLDGLEDLLRVVPRRYGDETVTRIRTETLFLKGETQEACEAVRGAIGRSDTHFWDQALAVCQVADGRFDHASLTVSLLRESGAVEDPTFFALFEAAERDGDEPPEVEALEPLHLAMVEATGLAVSEDVVANSHGSVRLAIVAREDAPLALRTRLAEQMAVKGALPIERLVSLYARFEFDSARLANAASLVDEDAVAAMTSTRRRALFYQAARDEPSAAVRAELIRQVVDEAAQHKHPAIARLFAPIIADMPVEPDLAWFARIAGRMLYAAQYDDDAQRWLTMAQQEAIINPEAKASVTVLVPYARLSGNADIPANGGLAAWRSAQGGIENENGGEAALTFRESLLRAAYDAFEESDARQWVEIASDGSGHPRAAPPAALIYALKEAGEAGRVGETVMLTLLVLGETGLRGVHPISLGAAITALVEAGLEPQARRLAIEAAVVNGI